MRYVQADKRVETFKKYGWNTIFISEKEVKNESLILFKLNREERRI